jgi:glutaredoxin/glutathione-dependent peroxiredoxin
MTIAVGETIPDVEVRRMGAEGPETLRTGDTLGKGRVVLFAVPGAFTPGCSKIHLPGFVQGAGDLAAKGVDTIACIAVNDPWVMDAWGKDQGVGDAILMLADGDGTFTKAIGLDKDLSVAGLGVRSARYAMVLQDGVVESLEVDTKGVEVSSCSAVLERL